MEHQTLFVLSTAAAFAIIATVLAALFTRINDLQELFGYSSERISRCESDASKEYLALSKRIEKEKERTNNSLGDVYEQIGVVQQDMFELYENLKREVDGRSKTRDEQVARLEGRVEAHSQTLRTKLDGDTFTWRESFDDDYIERLEERIEDLETPWWKRFAARLAE
jgi:hypothetical protein